jgi:hypothetical protein
LDLADICLSQQRYGDAAYENFPNNIRPDLIGGLSVLWGRPT